MGRVCFHPGLGDVKIATLRGYVAYLHECEYSRSTMARRLACLRSFFRYCCREQLAATNPAKALRTPRAGRRLPNFLSTEQVAQLLEAPPANLVRRVVETRMQHALTLLPERAGLPALYPFTEEQVQQVARTEPTLRDMLQQFRHFFDHVVFGEVQKTVCDEGPVERTRGLDSAAPVIVEAASPHRNIASAAIFSGVVNSSIGCFSRNKSSRACCTGMPTDLARASICCPSAADRARSSG